MKKIMLACLALAAFQALAADPVKTAPLQDKAQVVKPGIPDGIAVNPCPDGWSPAPGSTTPGGAYVCIPKKPAAANKQCPPGHQWFEDNCSFGCRRVVY